MSTKNRLGTKFKQAIGASANTKFSLILYVALALVRIFLTCLPQLGYIHPDEYFQSLEVIAGK